MNQVLREKMRPRDEIRDVESEVEVGIQLNGSKKVY